MDLDPFEPVGIAAPTMRFIDIFLLHCLLADSPPDTPAEIAALGRNQHRVAERGREPGLLLEQGDGRTVLLTDWAAQVLDECGPIAAALDAAHGGSDYQSALNGALAVLAKPAELPSARVLATMTAEFDSSYVAFIRAQSARTRQALLALPWTEAQAARYAALAADSVAEQHRIEEADTMPFEQYRQAYLSPERLQVRKPLATQA
jgi:glutamate--cysteine ligase